MTFDPDRCERFIDALTDAYLPTPEVAQATVLEAVTDTGLTGPDFIELDERPGQFDSRYDCHAWFRALRVTRNGDNDLFQRLAANNQKAHR